MNSFQSLRTSELLDRLRNLALEERRITLELIDHLREVERRMSYCDLGYGSLFEFCVKHLGLSEGSAHRRISAMRLMRDIPEAKNDLDSGKITLSNAARLHTVFQTARRENRLITRSQKREILKQVAGLTQRECEARLFRMLPETMKSTLRESERRVGEDVHEVRLLIEPELHQKLERLKGLLSHSIPDGSTLKLLDHLVTEALEREERKRGLVPRESASRKNGQHRNSSHKLHLTGEIPARPSAETDSEETLAQRTSTGPEHLLETSESAVLSSAPRIRAEPTERLHPSDSAAGQNEIKQSDLRESPPPCPDATPLPSGPSKAGVRRDVWHDSQGICEFPGCTSRFQLQIDHRQPRSLGGSDSRGNLRLLCRAHNIHQARERMGEVVMKRFVPSLR